MTVNNQIVVGTLMNLSDNPTRVSIGQDWRESDITHRVPIIVTGNDFSKIYAPLIRDGRMDKFYWYSILSQSLFFFFFFWELYYLKVFIEQVKVLILEILESRIKNYVDLKRFCFEYFGFICCHPFWQVVFLNRQPTYEDILNIVYRMYEKDGITKDEVAKVVSTFPNQGICVYANISRLILFIPIFNLDHIV